MTTLSFNLLGDGLRDALDVRTRPVTAAANSDGICDRLNCRSDDLTAIPASRAGEGGQVRSIRRRVAVADRGRLGVQSRSPPARCRRRPRDPRLKSARGRHLPRRLGVALRLDGQLRPDRRVPRERVRDLHEPAAANARGLQPRRRRRRERARARTSRRHAQADERRARRTRSRSRTVSSSVRP